MSDSNEETAATTSHDLLPNDNLTQSRLPDSPEVFSHNDTLFDASFSADFIAEEEEKVPF